MQLVVHSPYGGRINRALGLALRKKFCRTFNFELQAAASDDAIVLSLGPHHSFPLERGARATCAATTVEDTLEQADPRLADVPRPAGAGTSTGRSMVLRFRGGRRNPPPIQRMEADDLMAAVFPQAAACQENVRRPDRDPRPRARAPDHRRHACTRRSTSTASRALLERHRGGRRSRVHFVDTTEPSVLAHEILTGAPYTFLDEDPRSASAGRTRSRCAAGLPVDLASSAGSTRRRSSGCGRRRPPTARRRRAPRPAAVARR